MRWFKHSVRFLLVTVGIVVLTSFTIDATDALNGSQSALSILAKKATEGECSKGMIKIDLGERSFCVDEFENSPGSDCPVDKPGSADETQDNLNKPGCNSQSEVKAKPWTFISFHQAKAVCIARGGRLPSPTEWYEAAIGSPGLSGCNLDGNIADAGDFPSCVSSRGAHDMVGNVWEWVDTTIEDGVYNGRKLPSEGYVTEADGSGVAISTGSNGESMFGNDYFWSDDNGSRAMMRGGFYGSGEDGGVYAVHTKVAPSFSSAAIGFRCVTDL